MPRPTVHRTPFGSAHGAETGLWTLDSGTGVTAEVLSYGASLHRLTVPDTAGAAASVVRSLATIGDYTGKHPYFGAVVGRYANRIAHGRFKREPLVRSPPGAVRGRGSAAPTPRPAHGRFSVPGVRGSSRRERSGMMNRPPAFPWS
ncbi:hypothetical protein GCM10010518_01810 [Kitasatospora cinereorecta]